MSFQKIGFCLAFLSLSSFAHTTLPFSMSFQNETAHLISPDHLEAATVAFNHSDLGLFPCKEIHLFYMDLQIEYTFGGGDPARKNLPAKKTLAKMETKREHDLLDLGYMLEDSYRYEKKGNFYLYLLFSRLNDDKREYLKETYLLTNGNLYYFTTHYVESSFDQEQHDLFVDSFGLKK